MSSRSASRALALALLTATRSAGGCGGEGGETIEDPAALEPAPPLVLGVPETYDHTKAELVYEFEPLVSGGLLRVEQLPYAFEPYAVVLLLRSEGLELPERRDWEDPRFPTVDAAITRLDDHGQPAEELLMVTDYPVWFEPEGEDPGSELLLLQGQLWMQSDDLPVSPEALDGARVLLELELSTAEREPARASLELVLDLESRDS